MSRRAISVAVAAFLLATPAMADKCNLPNVARVVVALHGGITADNLNAPVWELVCPLTGDCFYHLTRPAADPPSRSVVCLTPEQNAAAMLAWRQ